jgi:hypothetical protein
MLILEPYPISLCLVEWIKEWHWSHLVLKGSLESWQKDKSKVLKQGRDVTLLCTNFSTCVQTPIISKYQNRLNYLMIFSNDIIWFSLSRIYGSSKEVSHYCIEWFYQWAIPKPKIIWNTLDIHPVDTVVGCCMHFKRCKIIVCSAGCQGSDKF